MVGLSTSDQAVVDHEFCARMPESAAAFDQLNVSNVACMELACRKMQMSEDRHRKRILSGSANDEL